MNKLIFIILLSFFYSAYSLTDTEMRFLKSCEEGKYEAVVSLINRKVNINAVSEDGVTGLMLASHHGHSAIVRLLINSNADVNISDKVGYTALIMASTGGYADIVNILLKAKADVNASNNYGETALHAASYGLYKDIVQSLVDYNADINSVNNDGYNALFMVFMSADKSENMLPLAEILCDNGIDINNKDKNGRTVLTYVKEHYKKPETLIEFLSSYGAYE
ncbi:ankyrin repeat domain-containing protein [uncultured Brachyspira sp.]|uniref:ankyrin repeat domain-containing protein n=1 Tax=uncultured Brachyspira sp. TaxID=221953 RepID=UPI0025CE6146|nr:ankyrin repeat domain-containing protein [uncultured Brachyspira sp.]